MEHSIINWIQISTKNLKRAVAFYENVFNANFFYEELNEIPHAVFTANGDNKKLLNGALIEVDNNTDIGTGTNLFFEATGKFDSIVARIENNGGKILKPKTLIKRKVSSESSIIPDTYIDDNAGYYAHFLDTEGNKMGLYGNN